MSSFIDTVLRAAKIVHANGTWTLVYKGAPYMLLLDATSRDEAELQIAEMLLVRAVPDGAQHNSRPDYTTEQPAAVIDSAGADWPSTRDVQFFMSELQLASMYLDMSMSNGPSADECRKRACDVYTSLVDWVNSNGGSEDIAQRLAWLRWRLSALKNA